MSNEENASIEQPRLEGGFWPSLAVVTALVMVLSAIRWSLEHPYGIHWDESLYFNDAHIDVLRIHGGMLLTLAKRLLLESSARPPAYRLLALPLLTVFGFHTLIARMVALACYALSCWFVYRAARVVGGRTAGAFAMFVFALAPEVISGSLFFGTDTPLYLATSAMLYFVLDYWKNSAAHPNNWIGLGAAIGLGFLAKSSFAAIAIPVLVFWLAAGLYGRVGIPSVFSQWKAGVLAALIAGPWWILNVKDAMAYAKYARDFVRNSLGPPSLGTWLRWLNTVLQSLLGIGLSILIALIVIAYIRKAGASKSALLNPLQRAALGVCACAGIPILMVQLSGTNHLLRHISPAVIPLAIAVGVLASAAGWGCSWTSIFASSILLGAQVVMLLTPVVFPNQHAVDPGFVNGSQPWRTMARYDQWDWSPVRNIANRCGDAKPKIAFLGSGRVFNPPSIQSPWLDQASAQHHAAADPPPVKWLWRYESGPVNWQTVMEQAKQNDIVITAPGYVGEVQNKEDLDNQHNGEFAKRLSEASDFRGPIRLQMGRFEPVEIDVFVKRTLACPAGEQSAASQ